MTLEQLIRFLKIDKSFEPYEAAMTGCEKIYWGTITYNKKTDKHKKGDKEHLKNVLGEIDPGTTEIEADKFIRCMTEDDADYVISECEVKPLELLLMDELQIEIDPKIVDEILAPFIIPTVSEDRHIVYFYKKPNGSGLVQIDEAEEIVDQIKIDNRKDEFNNHIDIMFKKYPELEDAFTNYLKIKTKTIDENKLVLCKANIFEMLIDYAKGYTIYPFPKILSNDANELAFANIDLNVIQNTVGQTDIIDAWLESRFRPDQIILLKQVIAKVLINNAPDIRGVYIYDPDGKHGKSTLLQALEYGFEQLNIHCCNMTTNGADKHQFVQYLGKSVCFNADVKNPNFVQTELFHMVTGGDTVTIDGKGQQPYKAKVKVTPFLAGNIVIELDTSKDHMMRRIVMLEMQPVNGAYVRSQMHEVDGKLVWNNAATFAKNFQEQMPAFICKCYRDTLGYNLAETEIIPSQEIVTDMVECDTTSGVTEKAIDMFIAELFDITGDLANDEIPFADICYYFQVGYKTQQTIGQFQLTRYVDHTYKGDARTPWGKSKIKQILVEKIKAMRLTITLDSEIAVKSRQRINGKQQKSIVIKGIKLKQTAILST